MRFTLVVWLCAIFSSIFPVTTVTDSVDALIARHVAAVGGLERINAIHSFALHMRYTEGSYTSDHGYLAYMRPFYRIVGNPTLPINKDSILEGYDGSSWEYYGDPGIVVRTIGPAAAATRHGAQRFIDRLYDYRSQGIHIVLLGHRKLSGVDELVLRETLRDGSSENVLLNAKSYLIDATEAIVPMHAFGDRLHLIELYSDYHPIGGVLFAYRNSEVDESTGKTLDSSLVLSVDTNLAYDKSYFSPPQIERTPLQSMIQRIYDERDSAVAVMETYYDFHPIVAVNTQESADAIDFVGYQCLKMGHAESAYRLLKANVAANPRYAPSHFGLGRVLDTEGKRAAAASEYRRALALDPGYARAKLALQALIRSPLK